ncbi:Hybrid signal transduction histidine kinase I [Hordeum vulgare]|nr:Hybrid signal transduction histidine kinase I [Hordeum vulgare]
MELKAKRSTSIKALLVEDIEVCRLVLSTILLALNCEAVVKIHAMGEGDVKIVGVSADDHAMEAFMNAGADAFVPKPMRREVLIPIIQDIINKNNNAMV